MRLQQVECPRNGFELAVREGHDPALGLGGELGALRAGASGFLLKRSRPEELIAAVQTIAAGDSLLSPSVTRRVVDRMAQQPTPELAALAKLDELTPREREVLELVARALQPRDRKGAGHRGS